MKYLVCIDQSTHSKKAFEMATRLLRPEDHLLVCSVGIWKAPLVPSEKANQEQKEIMEATEKLVSEFLLLAKKCGVSGPFIFLCGCSTVWQAGSVDGVVAVREDPREFIVETADEHKVDIIIIGARGVSAIKG